MDRLITVVMADDHQMFLDGMVTMLQRNRKIKILGTAQSGNSLLKLLEDVQPDIVVTDLQMEDLSGLEAIKIIRNRYPKIKVLALTMHNEAGFVRKLMEFGISGYILKNAGKQVLTGAIEKIADGGTYFSDAVMQTMMENLKNPSTKKNKDFPLSKREKQIISLICKEYTTNEIAGELNLSPLTIETHRKNIFLKLKVKNIAGLVRFAIRNNLEDMPR